MTSWEMLAVFLSVSYLLLAIKQNLWCWVAAFFSTLIYSILFFDASLLMDSALNIFYLIMAIYGWYSWKYGNSGKIEKESDKRISIQYGYFFLIIEIEKDTYVPITIIDSNGMAKHEESITENIIPKW